MMLNIKDLHVRIGNLSIIQGVTLGVDEREVVSLMGANGAGKTTLMRAISGIGHASAGTIEFMGEDITHWTSEKRVEAGLVQIPEGRQLFSLMSVRENLEIGAHTRHARSRIRDNLDYVYSIFPELKEMSSKAAGNLSGGQQQMVAVGRGIMADPKLLMLDEPSIGLSPLMTQRVLEAVAQINEKGVSVLIAEQNIFDVLKIADRAYVLEQGLIRASGSAQDILNSDDIKEIKDYDALTLSFYAKRKDNGPKNLKIRFKAGDKVEYSDVISLQTKWSSTPYQIKPKHEFVKAASGKLEIRFRGYAQSEETGGTMSLSDVVVSGSKI